MELVMRSCVLGLLALLPGCASIRDTFTVEAKLLAGVGGPVEIQRNLPLPTDPKYLPRGCAVKSYLPNLEADEAFNARLADALRSKAGREFVSVRGTDKEPVVLLEVAEIQYKEETDFSRIGGVTGLVLGGAAGYGAGHSSAYPGAATGAGALVGTALGSWAFGAELHCWTFMVKVTQMTSAEGKQHLFADKRRAVLQVQGSYNQDPTTMTNSAELQRMASTTTFDVSSNSFTDYRIFTVVVKGPRSILDVAEAREKAKAKLLEGLPGLLFGGEQLM